MAYEMVMPYHLHMPSYFLETFTEYPFFIYRCNLLFFYERPTNQIIRVTVISGKSCKNISNNPSSFILLAFTTILT